MLTKDILGHEGGRNIKGANLFDTLNSLCIYHAV